MWVRGKRQWFNNMWESMSTGSRQESMCQGKRKRKEKKSFQFHFWLNSGACQSVTCRLHACPILFCLSSSYTQPERIEFRSFLDNNNSLRKVRTFADSLLFERHSWSSATHMIYSIKNNTCSSLGCEMFSYPLLLPWRHVANKSFERGCTSMPKTL